MTESFQEQLTLICELQKIDLNLYNFNKMLGAFPVELAEFESAYNIAKTELAVAKTELSEVEKAKKADEIELAASVEFLRNREARIYAIKTNKEYQSALKEVSDGKRTNKEREDRILAQMEKIDTLTQKITQLNLVFADKEGVYKKKSDELAAREKEIRAQMVDDEVRRPLVVEKIDKVISRKYDFIRKRYVEAVTSVVGGVCQGCLRKIPAQFFNEMLKKTELKACPNCQRLLYVIETPPEEVADEKVKKEKKKKGKTEEEITKEG